MKVRVVVVVVDQTNLDRPKLALTGAFILFTHSPVIGKILNLNLSKETLFQLLE